MRTLVIGLTRELPLPPSDALDIADKLVARAANAHTSGTLYIVLLNNESTQKYTACIVLFSQCSYIRYIVYSLIE